MLRQGDRVSTPFGPGVVAFVRMAPPTYATIEAVSVVLDRHRTRLNYTGTMLAAGEVTRVDADAGALAPDPFYRGKQSRGSIHD